MVQCKAGRFRYNGKGFEPVAELSPVHRRYPDRRFADVDGRYVAVRVNRSDGGVKGLVGQIAAVRGMSGFENRLHDIRLFVVDIENDGRGIKRNLFNADTLDRYANVQINGGIVNAVATDIIIFGFAPLEVGDADGAVGHYAEIGGIVDIDQTEPDGVVGCVAGHDPRLKLNGIDAVGGTEINVGIFDLDGLNPDDIVGRGVCTSNKQQTRRRENKHQS